ncbi:MAG: Arylsulfatase [Flavobacteriales bacterium]|nr:MAG: Arylsulfatase [Flavobacteriales bacterium]
MYRFMCSVLVLTLSFLGTSQEQPNVLLIMADDLNDYIGAFGGHPDVKTPNMDRLAALGVQFSNAHTNVPVCQPSRNSLFTGVYPHESKDFGWTLLTNQKVLKHNKTIMQYFIENGYHTLGTGKLTHGKPLKTDWLEWGNNWRHNYGPFYFDGEKIGVLPTVPDPFRQIGTIDGSYGKLSDGGKSNGSHGSIGLVYGHDKKPFKYLSDDDRDLLQGEKHTRWAIQKLKELSESKTEKPFFMGVGFVRPHTPLHAPDEYFDMYPVDEIELDKWLDGDELDTFWKENYIGDLSIEGDVLSAYNLRRGNLKGPVLFNSLVKSYGGNRELALKYFVQAYLACVTFVDDQVGKIIDALEATGLSDNTMIILTSDHGWQMGEKGHLFKGSPWEESTRIPLLFKLPKSQIKGTVQHPVSLVDVFPTLIDYCKLKGSTKKSDLGGNLGGYSLRPFLENPDTKKWDGPDVALTMMGNYGNYAKDRQNYSIRGLHFRYIRYSNGKEELYDHRKDPYEWYNLALESEYKKQLKKFRKQLYQFLK